MTQLTSKVVQAEPVCKAVSGLTPEKASIVAMVAEAFLNGMTAQQILTSDSAPAQTP